MAIYTVSQIARYVGERVDTDPVLKELYITGEIIGVSKSAAGHCYFSLKDGESQLRCVAFRTGVGLEFLDNGASVTLYGRVGFYQARGDLQVYVDQVHPEGVGELHMEFLRLRAKLEAEGMFEPSRKRPLPRFPKRIAVVTSRAGAVLHDIKNVIERRYPLVELLLVHTPVQGDLAPRGLVGGLRAANQTHGVDLVILARGGGGMEEMHAFNEESVARAIHGSRIPVVSAVGHETDVTIADLVADARAPTPSAAAELVVPNRRELRRRLFDYTFTMRHYVANQVLRRRQDVRAHVTHVRRLTPSVTSWRQRVDELTRAAAAVVSRDVALRAERVSSRIGQLGALRPSNTLARGYSVVERQSDGQLISKLEHARLGDDIAIHVTDGELHGLVTRGDALGRTVARRRRLAPGPEQIPLWS
jgi:exodeoxyribonuclease VII large subunit